MSKKLIVYYSYTGNTRKIANTIHKEIGADLLEIQTIEPYSTNYDEVVEQAKLDVKKEIKPEIKPINVNLSDYDTIILGTPVWWYTMAPAVLTFLTSTTWENKKIIPFATNAGWLGHTFEDIKKACPDAVIEKEMNIEFSQNQLSTKIEDWIKCLE